MLDPIIARFVWYLTTGRPAAPESIDKFIHDDARSRQLREQIATRSAAVFAAADAAGIGQQLRSVISKIG